MFNFENKGLTITQKNGKVYVSLDESLLFASGSYTVGERGTDALKKLAKVLEQNQDINILVEGHTDNVPLKGSGDIKDNWDLSVKRATTVVRLLQKEYGMDPMKMAAAGRGEYHPVGANDTNEGKALNRRTRIVILPQLDQFFKLLEPQK